MTANRHAGWSESDLDMLRRMLAAGESFSTIARAMKRVQTDVASKAFNLKMDGTN